MECYLVIWFNRLRGDKIISNKNSIIIFLGEHNQPLQQTYERIMSSVILTALLNVRNIKLSSTKERRTKDYLFYFNIIIK